MEITKRLIDKLSDSDISKKEYDGIIATINKKVEEIWSFIISASGRKSNWWAFRNDLSLGQGNGSTGGYFDPNKDSEFIEIIGEITHSQFIGYEYNDGFPTNFLWEDYKSIVRKHLAEVREKTKKKKSEKIAKLEENRKNRKLLIESVKGKLNKEELKLIKFK